jgi:3-dehydroquinate synthase
MIAASLIARDAGFCSKETAAQITTLVKEYGPLPPVPCATEEVLRRLSADKKTVAGEVHFVLPQRIGKTAISSEVAPDVVRNAVEEIRHG